MVESILVAWAFHSVLAKEDSFHQVGARLLKYIFNCLDLSLCVNVLAKEVSLLRATNHVILLSHVNLFK